MTCDDWIQRSENFFNLISQFPDLMSYPEWSIWKQKIEEQLNSMDYEDALGCELKDLLNLTGVIDELRLARKKTEVDSKLKAMEQDFKEKEEDDK